MLLLFALTGRDDESQGKPPDLNVCWKLKSGNQRKYQETDLIMACLKEGNNHHEDHPNIDPFNVGGCQDRLRYPDETEIN